MHRHLYFYIYQNILKQPIQQHWEGLIQTFTKNKNTMCVGVCVFVFCIFMDPDETKRELVQYQ